MYLINVLDIKTHNVKTLQQQDTFCKCIYSELYVPWVKNKFTIKDDTLFKIIQDVSKSFEALIIPKSLTLTLLVTLHNIQGHIGTKKFLLEKMHEYIDKFIQNCHIGNIISKKKQYICINIKPPKRPLDSIALEVIVTFHLSSKENTYVPTCMCPLLNFPITIPIPDKTAVKAYLQHIYAIFGGHLTLITDNGNNLKRNSSKKVHLN